jgi:hypothetical protein
MDAQPDRRDGNPARITIADHQRQDKEQNEERRMIKNSLCGLFLLIQFLVLPGTLLAYQERLILSLEAGKCVLRVEADDESRVLRLRVHPEDSDCGITKILMQTILRAAFSKTDPPKLEGTYSSLYLGRLIDYPWLSEYLALTASQDPRWDKKRGQPVSIDINKYVSIILSRKEAAGQIEEAFGDTGYRVSSVSVEKVLVGGFRNVPHYRGEMATGQVPFDAQVWFKLEKK